MAYFTQYYGPYFHVEEAPLTPGGITNGGGLIGPGRSEIDRAKRWLELEVPYVVSIKETLKGPKDYIVAYSVSPQKATEIKVIEPERLPKRLPKAKLSMSGTVSAVQDSISLSLSWTAAQARDDEELLLFL